MGRFGHGWIAAVLLLAACSAGIGDPAAVPSPAALPSPAEGDVLAAEELAGPEPGRAWRVRYRSRALDGAPIEVTGVVVRPEGPAPRGGFPVVAWGHGTTGTADACAPSREGVRVPALRSLLDAGFVVAATDYEGLGTPGAHPYLAGESAGRGLLDAARAAARLPGADASARVVVHGESQGGHAALWAAQVAPGYAPELDLLGAVAAAPAADLPALIAGAARSPATFPYAFLVYATWAETFATADLSAVVTPAVAAQAGLAETACLDGVFGAFATQPLDALAVADPATVPAWAELLERNAAGTEPLPVPVLLVHGEDDPLIPVALSVALRDRLCAGDQPVALRTYAGAGHGVVAAAAPDIAAWLTDRAAGRAAPEDCGRPGTIP